MSGTDLVATLPEGERVVGMVVWNDRCILATTCGVYEVRGNVCVPIRLAAPQPCVNHGPEYRCDVCDGSTP